MPSIFPSTTGGGIAVTDSNGDVIPSVFGTIVSGYVPPDTFTMTCPVTFYGGAACDMRFQPFLINAMASELLALAAAMNPNGTWNCGLVTNLATAFLSSNQTEPLVDAFDVPLGNIVP